MKISISKFKTHAYKSFFMSYIYFIIITTLICSIMYALMYRIIEADNEKLYMSMLRHSNDIVTQYVTKTENIVKQLNANHTASALLSGENDNPNAFIDMTTLLQTYNTDNFIGEICLYSHKTDRLISSNTVYPLKTMYGSFIKYGDKNYTDFYNDCLMLQSYNSLFHSENMLLNSENTDCILSVSTLPLWERDSSRIYGNLLIFIDTKKLLGTISETFKTDSSYVYFYNGGTLIAGTDNAPQLDTIPSESRSFKKIDGTKYIIFSTGSSEKYNFAVAVPASIALRPLADFRMLVILSLIFSTLIYITLALILSRSNVKPLQTIIKRFKDSSSISGINEYSLITDKIDSLIGDNEHFRDEYNSMLPVMRSDFAWSLINGQMTDADSISAVIKKLDIDFDSDRYMILLLSLMDILPNSISDIEKITLSKELLSSSLSSHLRLISCRTSDTDMAAIICCTENDINDELILIENTVNDASDYLYNRFSIRLKAALSSEFNSLTDTFFIYQSAVDTLNNGIYTSYNHTVWCSTAANMQPGYYYPTEMENKIIQYFKRSDADKIYAVLDNIQEKNLEQYIPFGKNIFYLYYNIKSTIYKILNTEGIVQDKQISSYLDMMNSDKTVKQFIDLAKELFKYMLELKSGEDLNSDLSEQFISFVSSRYKDPSFGRHAFAEKFHITDDYVSKIFKEYTGFQFHEYLTKLRIDSACIMLREGNHNVEKIASSIGYNSAVAFRRSFKAYTGMTPKEYKLKASAQDSAQLSP